MSSRNKIMGSVIVCGGRSYGNRDVVNAALKEHLAEDDVVWHGGAKGADTLAGQEAEYLEHDVIVVPAQWGRYGRSAGPIRNAKMMKYAKPRLVIAFPGGKGTAHMVGTARGAGVPVVEVEEE